MSVPPDQTKDVFQQMMQAGQSMTKAYMDFLTKQQSGSPAAGSPPAMPMPDLEPFARMQQEFAAQHAQLWQSMLQRKQGEAAEPLVKPEPGDRRFSAPEWADNPFFDYLRQAYLLNSAFLTKAAETAPIEDGPSKTRMQFVTRLLVEAMAPSNFAATNPEFIKTAVETKGESITNGLKNMLEDLQKGRISMTDEAAFEIGTNIATTPGSVVYENELIQLIQYTPTTDKVAERPLLIFPPFINKFYLMDLQPENSFVAYAVEQGFTDGLSEVYGQIEQLGFPG